MHIVEGGGPKRGSESEGDEVDQRDKEEARRIDGITGVIVSRFRGHTMNMASVVVDGM